MAELDETESRQINMTPLVDVSLTLVLIFMVTMPLSQIHGVKVKREVLTEYGLTTPQENIVVHLTSSGIYIQDENGVNQRIPYVDYGVVLRQLIQISFTKDFLLHVDRDVPHGQTVWAIDLAKQNGANSIALFEGES
ncbi:hypothetical protein BVX98_01000 [bacterium F11]|nr:hypothetical protein BVX98_01000 [bacterium F11]